MGTRRTRSMVLLLTVALALGACGGGDDFAAGDFDGGGMTVPVGDDGMAPDGGFGGPDDPGAVGSSEGPEDAPTQQEPGKVASLGELDGVSDVFTPLAELGDGSLAMGAVGTTTADLDACDPLLNPGGCDAVEAPGTEPEVTVTVSYVEAVITVDGKRFTLAKGQAFPNDSQLFTLESIGSSTVVVRLTAGEFAGGSDGITLRRGNPVRLVNASEGEEYVLQLVRTRSETSQGTSFQF